MKIILLHLVFILQIISSISNSTKSNYTFDEFFDYTVYSLLSFSPTQDHLLIQTQHPSWNNHTFVYTLWIYDVQTKVKTLVTDKLHPSIQPKWSPSGNWIALSLYSRKSPTDSQNQTQYDEHIYLYSLASTEFIPIRFENELPLTYTWSNNDTLLFVLTRNSPSAKKEVDDEWQDVIRYREKLSNQNYTLSQIHFDPTNISSSIQNKFIRNLSNLAIELVYVPSPEKLVFLAVPTILENIENYEIYSLDLQHPNLLWKLTENEARERDLQLSIDGKQLFYQAMALHSSKKKANDSQSRLYSIDLITGQINQFAKSFQGHVVGYALKSDQSVYILGQMGTEVHIYTCQLFDDTLIYHHGWNGTYQSLAVSKYNPNKIAFVHSSYAKPMEVYLIENLHQLSDAQPITNHNQLFTQRNLPKVKVYSWKNEDDNQTIEGLLHYPQGQFEGKNLPLLVLIHGGPYYASMNLLVQNGGDWASLAATNGWLVLEPNFRGSTGYGDEFLNQIRTKPLSLTGKDVLYGVDQLIRDGIADPNRLAVGGYSYGGFLTNWLITQTKRFNAALSGAGAVDHTSTWGTLDIPVLIENLFGGYPWTVPHKYQDESPLYQLDRVRTPTLIVTGEVDVRVPASQSYMLERALYYRGIPVELLVFPNEGHSLSYDPWHQKIKVREELKWLEKYGKRRVRI